MTQQTYTRISGIIFGVVALAHLCRLWMGWSLVVGSYSMPMWASILGFLIAGYLTFSAFKLQR